MEDNSANELGQDILTILKQRGPVKRLRDGEYRTRCLRPERHRHGDAPPSMDYNPRKGCICRVCGFQAGLATLARELGVDPNSEEIQVYESDMRRFLSEDEIEDYTRACELRQDVERSFLADATAKFRQAFASPDNQQDGGFRLTQSLEYYGAVQKTIKFLREKADHYIELAGERKRIEKNRPMVIGVLKPPISDAKRLLPDEQFEQLMGCIDSFADYGSPEDAPIEVSVAYENLLDEVKRRLEEEQRKRLADVEWDAFERRFDSMLGDVIKVLGPADYDLAMKKMQRVKPDYPGLVRQYGLLNWTDFKPAPPRKDIVNKLAQDSMKDKLPAGVLPYVSYEARWWNFPVPRHVEYLMGDEGISSLRWVFDHYIVGEIAISLRGGRYRKTLYDYEYHLSLSALPLGFLITEPLFYQQSAFSFSTPLVLLAGLARGDMEPHGTRIMGRSSGLTTYEVEGFQDKIAINDSFARFLIDACQGQPLAQGLLAKRLADPMTATTIERHQGL